MCRLVNLSFVAIGYTRCWSWTYVYIIYIYMIIGPWCWSNRRALYGRTEQQNTGKHQKLPESTPRLAGRWRNELRLSKIMAWKQSLSQRSLAGRTALFSFTMHHISRMSFVSKTRTYSEMHKDNKLMKSLESWNTNLYGALGIGAEGQLTNFRTVSAIAPYYRLYVSFSGVLPQLFVCWIPIMFADSV